MLLKSWALEGYENYGLNSLSGGQFQRVLFARLILQDAQCFYLMNPFLVLMKLQQMIFYI